MEKLSTVLLITGTILAAVAYGEELKDKSTNLSVAVTANATEIDNVYHGGQASLRGLTELDVTRKADPFKRVLRDRSPYVSDYVYQPPLIPHQIRGYEISTNAQ